MASCGVFRAAGSRQGSASGATASGAARLERRELDHHPPINLLVRLGDPLPALAFATTHDAGSVASVALSALLLSRLRAHGISEVMSVPSQSGLELAVLCADRGAAQAFVAQISEALATPIVERDPALPLIQEHLAALRSRSFAGRAEASLAGCSGELGQLPGAALPDVRSAAGREELEKYRRFAFARSSSAFAALGSPDFVNAAASELAKVRDWPSGDPASDTWPTSDVVDSDAADGPRRLSVALRLGDAEAALSSLDALTADHGALSSRLRAFLPGYAVERVMFRTRPRGACLRVDLSLPEGEPAPTPQQAAQAAQIASEELRGAARPRDSLRALDDNVVEPSDPRQAAARAAWRALTGRLEPGATRRFVVATVHAAERPAFNALASALSDLETRPARAPFEVRLRAEPGQGQLWLLLASPCGALGESNDAAGQSALALTLAAHRSSADVALEPWLTADAVGLLAHAPRKPGETPIEQAERIARALALALTERSAGGDAFAIAQGELLSAIGRVPRPGYARLLDALAPDHSAWLEPRGTWSSLALANHDSVLARARDLLRGPLRVAVLANEDEAQAAGSARALERWFAPWRDDLRRCQATPERPARSGEISLAVPDPAGTESGYVGLPFASRLKYEREAEAVADLLNAPGGLLSQAFSTEHLNASAHVSLVGGARAAALVIEVHANEDEERKATLEVRRVLDRVVAAPLSNAELARAQRAAEQRALAASLDPRRRIVDLWRGSAPEPSLSRSSLRAFQAALAGAAQVVVHVTHRD